MVATAVDQTLEYSISAAEKDEVIRSLDDVIDEQDGRAYNVRPCIAAPSASPAFKDPDKAPIDLTKLAADVFLSDTLKRAALEDALSKENVERWKQFDRPELLNHLKSLNLNLSERQKCANAFGKLIRSLRPKSVEPSVPVMPTDAWKKPYMHDAAPVFELRGSDVPTPAGGEATRAEIRHLLLTGAASYEGRQGQVRVKSSPNTPLWNWTRELGECGDPLCSCFRLTNPTARSRFRNLVVSRTVEQIRSDALFRASLASVRDYHSGAGNGDGSEDAAAATGHNDLGAAVKSAVQKPPTAGGVVRYVSVGCGQLLTDFEILCGLQEKGMEIGCILLCDTAYDHNGIYGAGDLKTRQPFNLLAGMFLQGKVEGRLSVFNSLKQLERACETESMLFGELTTYIHCDSEDIKQHESNRLAARLLVGGGHAFQLHNDGSRSGGGRISAWRKRTTGESHVSFGPGSGWSSKPSDSAVVQALQSSDPAHSLTAITIRSTEGVEPLLNIREIAKSMQNGRIFRVVHSKVVVRAEPSTKSTIRGLKESGQHVIVDEEMEVAGEWWVRLSRRDPWLAGVLSIRRASGDRGVDGWAGNSSVNMLTGGEAFEAWMLTYSSQLSSKLLQEEDKWTGRDLFDIPLDEPRNHDVRMANAEECVACEEPVEERDVQMEEEKDELEDEFGPFDPDWMKSTEEFDIY